MYAPAPPGPLAHQTEGMHPYVVIKISLEIHIPNLQYSM